MIGRIWTTRVRAGRAAEYEDFARAVSLPMFRRQPGFRGAVMMRRGEDCLVVTFWRDMAAVEALGRSEAYARTVRAIHDRGLLHGDQTVESYPVHLAADVAG